MLLRLQFTAKTFAHMLRVRFAQQDLCVAPINDDYVVDRVEITDTMLDHVFSPPDPPFTAGGPAILDINDADGNPVPLHVQQLNFSQPVNVFVTSMSALAANPTGAAPAALPVTLYLVFALTVESSGLSIAYQALSHQDLLPAGIPIADIQNALQQGLPTIHAPLDFTSALAHAGGPALVAVASGLGALTDQSVIELRVELQPAGALGSAAFEDWQTFFDGAGLDDLTNGNDWAMLLDKDILTGIAVSGVQTAVGTSDQFALTSAIVPTWTPSEPGISIAFTGDVKNACDCAWGSIDVSTDITIDAAFSVADGALQQDLHLSGSPHFWPTVCCEITDALLWPLFVVEGNFDLKTAIIGSIAYYYFGPLAIFAGAVLLVHASVPAQSIPNCTQDPGDTSHYTCVTPIDVNGDPPMCGKQPDWLAIVSARGIDAGLVLSGTYTDNQLAPPITEVSATTPFTWLPPSVNCSGTTGAWIAEATVEVQRASGDLDFFLCSAQAIGVTAPEFNPLISVDYAYCPLRATVRVRVPHYTDDDCTLLILTSGGARLVYVPMMQPLTQEQDTEFQESARLWRLKNCFNKPVPWNERIKMRWLVDPPLGDTKHERVYEVIAWRMVDGATLRIFGPGDQVLAEATPNAIGSAQLSLVQPAGADIEILASPPTGRTQGRTHGIDAASGPALKVRELLLVALDHVDLASPALAVALNRNPRGSVVVTIVTRDQVRAFAIQQAGRLRLVASHPTPAGLIGATVAAGVITAWDQMGTRWQLDSRGQGAPSSLGPSAQVVTARSSDANGSAQYYVGTTPMQDGSAIMGKWMTRLDADGLTLRLFRLGGIAEF